MSTLTRWHYKLAHRYSNYRKLARFYFNIKIPFLKKIPLYRIVSFYIKGTQDHSISDRAAAVAFNLLLSLFPALIFLFTLIPYIPIPDLEIEVLTFMQDVVPHNAYVLIYDTLQDLLVTRRTGLLSVGLVTSIYFASSGVYTLISVFNTKDDRNFWKKRLVGIALTFAIGLTLIISVGTLVLSEYILHIIIEETIKTSYNLDLVFTLLRWLINFLTLFTLIVIFYRTGDSRMKKLKDTYTGAIIATILSVATSVGYGFYVDNIANYNKLYGSLGAIVITMLLLYFNSMVIIIGHEINVSILQTLERHKPKKKIELMSN
jgi:membrane protein